MSGVVVTPTQADHALAQEIISCIRGYGVTISREHTVVGMIARHAAQAREEALSSSDRNDRVKRRLANIAGAEARIGTFPENIRKRLHDWQADQSEWFDGTVLEIVAEFIMSDDKRRLPAAREEGARMMREAAANLCDERGAFEQEGYGLVRATQNYFRARDCIRALDPAEIVKAGVA